ncbi:hypothetical protein ACFQVA_30335 [Actinomadura keratinilytica]
MKSRSQARSAARLSLSPVSSAARAWRACARSAKTASSRACRVGKWRRTVAEPSPAVRATRSMEAAAPSSAISASATVRMRR